MAIGQPFDPVAPLMGAGVKMKTNWYFRSAIRSSNVKFSWLKMPCLVCSSEWHGKARLLSGFGTTSTPQVSPPVMHKSLSMPSRPGELHPEPLTDPDLILSHHPALTTVR